MDRNFIHQTNYFTDPWTWTKRSFEFLLVIGFLFLLHTMEAKDAYRWITFALCGIGTIYIFTRPVDELVLDNLSLFYVRKSIVPLFTKTKEYKLSSIQSIGCGGLYDRDTELMMKGRPADNRLEIIFKDDSSEALDIKIYKGELKFIVENVRKLLRQAKAQ